MAFAASCTMMCGVSVWNPSGIGFVIICLSFEYLDEEEDFFVRKKNPANLVPPGNRGRILEPPPDRGCVRRTSRSKCGCPESLSCPKTPGLAVPLRLVLRTQPRSVPVLLVVVSRCAPARAGRHFLARVR